jgi:DNA-binding NarL/FixJ family response regulator
MSGLKEIKVFIIEDDFIFIEILAGILDTLNEELASKNVKIHYQTFYSNREASFELRLNPQIILLDYFIMDDELNADTGTQLLNDIKKHDTNIDVIVVSGQESPEVKKELIEKGATAYISKDQDSLNTLKPLLMEIISKRIS